MKLNYEYALDIGIPNGQVVHESDQLYVDSNWYNQNATLVGNGDIAVDQPEMIANRLMIGEVFAIVPSWQPSLLNKLLRTESEPGYKYISNKFAMIIFPRCVYLQGINAQYRHLPKVGDLPTISNKTAFNWMVVAQDKHRQIETAEKNMVSELNLDI